MNDLRFPVWPVVINSLMRRGVTQTQIESETGISQSFLSNLKSGRRESLGFEQGMKLLAIYYARVRGVRIGVIKINGKTKKQQQ